MEKEERKPLAEHFEHGADVGIRGWGATAEEAFAGAAAAVSRLWASDPASVRSEAEAEVGCEAADLEHLLVAFLDELIYLFAIRRFLFAYLAVRIEAPPGAPLRLTAQGAGERFDARRHESTVEPKGATLTALRVARVEGRWVAQCVVDV
ncbi:MAG: archease [Thermoanaerobaculia bacterium]